jgi:tetratricopeptide (TPR) repeat protein
MDKWGKIYVYSAVGIIVVLLAALVIDSSPATFLSLLLGVTCFVLAISPVAIFLGLYSDFKFLNRYRAFEVYRTGIQFQRRKVFDTAISKYTRALELFPEYEPALINRGVCYAEKGERDNAKEDSQKLFNSMGVCGLISLIRVVEPSCFNRIDLKRHY